LALGLIPQRRTHGHHLKKPFRHVATPLSAVQAARASVQLGDSNLHRL
jgi:hypothetical protein